MMLEDQRLNIFEAVAREQSFTVAARKLGLSQPAVSQCIAELERKVGERLFDRQRGAVTLTPAGETFRLFAARIRKDYEDLNTVFSDYEAFASVAERLTALRKEPSFPLLRDLLSQD